MAADYFKLIRKNRLAAWIICALLSINSSGAFAQLPLPPLPLPDPFGIFGTTDEEKEKALGEIVSVGMERKPAGTAPYGVTPSGDPLWPVPDPEPAKTATAKVETAKAAPAVITSPSSSGQVSNEKHTETINCMVARNSFEGRNISPLINKTLTAGEKSNLPGRPVADLSEKEIEALQYSFIYDLQRHAKFIYEGKNALATAVACKWKLIGSLHSNQIDEITFNIATKNNFPKFSLWIESVIEQDKKFIENP